MIMCFYCIAWLLAGTFNRGSGFVEVGQCFLSHDGRLVSIPDEVLWKQSMRTSVHCVMKY